MKLKKIASLALAGVMAVSMLAGCATKAPETGDENTNVTVTAGATAATVEAFNSVQDKVEFTSDAALQSMLEKVVKADAGTKKNVQTKLEEYIMKSTGEVYATAFDGEKDSTMISVMVGGTADNIWSEDAAIAYAKKAVKDQVASYKETTFDEDNQKAGSDYYNYTYTGKVATASHTLGDGSVVYYVAYTITQNVTKLTYGL